MNTYFFLLLLSLNILLCHSFDRMFISICGAVCKTIKHTITKTSIHIHSKNNKQHFNTSLIIFKGSHIKSSSYIGISNIIQKIGNKRGLNVNITIPEYRFGQDLSNYIEPSSFILGHSQGVYDIISKNLTSSKGLIQYGSVLNSKGKLPWLSNNLENFPIPVLTLLGKKDGFLRHIYGLDELYNQSDYDKLIRKPIIILKDTNHLHLSNTNTSLIANLFGLKDIKSNLTTDKAWYFLSSIIVDFMLLNIDKNNTDSLNRMKILQKDTSKLLNVYVEYNDINYIINFLTNLQYKLLNNTIHNISFYDYYDFLKSKPNDALLSCYIEKHNFFSKMYFTPLWIKTKYKKFISAQRINERLFWEIASKIDCNTNTKIKFIEDKYCFTTLEWLLSNIVIKKNDNTIYISSPVFVTYPNTWKYNNFYYMKILSPAQIIELINIDLQDFYTF